jgi:arabinan endo-1,5-alpha-L-arabinosidase
MRYWALPFIGLTFTVVHCGAPEPQSGTAAEENTSSATQADLGFIKLPGPGILPSFPGLPPTVIPLSGDLRAPDPSIIRDRRRGDWYVFSTGDPTIAGGTAQIRHSTDLKSWTTVGTVFDQIPAWVVQAVPGVQNIWAPNVIEHDGTYYLYYAASTFGSNVSVIGLATNTTLDLDDPAYQWVDHGLVTGTNTTNDYNAIDPAVVNDASNTPWLSLGSFFSGIRMFQLTWPSGMLAPGQGQPLRLADRFVPPNALEASFIQPHDGWYYLFVSFDFCCQGTNSTYKIAVGRSKSANGPYFDRLGTPMEHGGGTVILSENGTMFGPGGESLYGDLIAYHFYDGTANGDIRLGIRTVSWVDGWPLVSTLTTSP